MKKTAALFLLLVMIVFAMTASAATFTDAHGNVIELDESLEAYAAVQMTGGAQARAGETNLGDFWADALRWFAVSGAINEAFEEDDVKAGITSLDVDEDHVVALWNAGNLRADIEVGVFNAEKIAEVLPYPNKVAVIYMTGAQLQEQLEACAQGLPCTDETEDACAAFMQVSGLDYAVDLTKAYEAGEAYGDHWFRAASVNRVTVKAVNGQAFDPDAVYAVITSNANFNGMDASYLFKEAAEAAENSTITTAVVRDVIWKYLTEALDNQIGDAYAAPAGRIEMIQ
ncbi:MAG: 5'-nucleotidase C-terminal domain-containing protein [Clostridia bacterium]|nr:5'-nucleotidase C-terminal domain-containing protein [Clostridia bacterium]